MNSSRKLKIDYNAPFTLTFCLLATIVQIVGSVTGGWFQLQFFSLAGNSSFADFATWPRLLTHVLGHGSLEHLIYNITVILLIGPLLEEMYGATKLLGLTLITALATGLVMVFFFQGQLLGASGVVFAFIILASFARAKAGTLPLTFIFVTVLYLGNEIYQAYSADDNIAQFAHIMGGLCGGLFGYTLARRRRK